MSIYSDFKPEKIHVKWYEQPIVQILGFLIGTAIIVTISTIIEGMLRA